MALRVLSNAPKPATYPSRCWAWECWSFIPTAKTFFAITGQRIGGHSNNRQVGKARVADGFSASLRSHPSPASDNPSTPRRSHAARATATASSPWLAIVTRMPTELSISWASSWLTRLSSTSNSSAPHNWCCASLGRLVTHLCPTMTRPAAPHCLHDGIKQCRGGSSTC